MWKWLDDQLCWVIVELRWHKVIQNIDLAEIITHSELFTIIRDCQRNKLWLSWNHFEFLVLQILTYQVFPKDIDKLLIAYSHFGHNNWNRFNLWNFHCLLFRYEIIDYEVLMILLIRDHSVILKINLSMSYLAAQLFSCANVQFPAIDGLEISRFGLIDLHILFSPAYLPLGQHALWTQRQQSWGWGLIALTGLVTNRQHDNIGLVHIFLGFWCLTSNFRTSRSECTDEHACLQTVYQYRIARCHKYQLCVRTLINHWVNFVIQLCRHFLRHNEFHWFSILLALVHRFLLLLDFKWSSPCFLLTWYIHWTFSGFDLRRLSTAITTRHLYAWLV